MGPLGTWCVLEDRLESPLGSWRAILAIPQGPLAGVIEAVWASEAFDCFEEEEIVPRSCTDVLFGLGDRHWLHTGGTADDPARRSLAFDTSFISGLQRAPLHVESPATCCMAGIRLRPEGVAAFLRDTPSTIRGAVVELEDILGRDVEHLREQVATVASLRGRVALLTAALDRHLGEPRLPSPEVRLCLAALRGTAGRVPIRELVRASGRSHRWLTEHFRDEVGTNPKSFARLLRFEAAFGALQGVAEVDWAEFAAGRGFYDQAHLVREFRDFAGAPPTEVLRRLSPDGIGLLRDADDGAESDRGGR